MTNRKNATKRARHPRIQAENEVQDGSLSSRPLKNFFDTIISSIFIPNASRKYQ